MKCMRIFELLGNIKNSGQKGIDVSIQFNLNYWLENIGLYLLSFDLWLFLSHEKHSLKEFCPEQEWIPRGLWGSHMGKEAANWVPGDSKRLTQFSLSTVNMKIQITINYHPGDKSCAKIYLHIIKCTITKSQETVAICIVNITPKSSYSC